MIDRRPQVDSKKVDTKEFEFPETLFVRDIDNRVFQGIVLQVLAAIEGISLVEGNFIDNLLGRSTVESIKGIQADQDMRNHSISIKLEINVAYGISIPEKAEEIQSQVSEQLTKLTGLHVSSVHVVFKNVIPPGTAMPAFNTASSDFVSPKSPRELDEYSDEF